MGGGKQEESKRECGHVFAFLNVAKLQKTVKPKSWEKTVSVSSWSFPGFLSCPPWICTPPNSRTLPGHDNVWRLRRQGWQGWLRRQGWQGPCRAPRCSYGEYGEPAARQGRSGIGPGQREIGDPSRKQGGTHRRQAAEHVGQGRGAATRQSRPSSCSGQCKGCGTASGKGR